MGTSYNCNIATDGLVLCLDAANPRSYPLSGTSWNDLSTSKENASLSNITFDANNKGSFVFDGTNDKISLSNNSNFDLSNGNFTIISWFYISTAGDTTNLYYWIFSFGNSAGQTSGTTFYLRIWRSGLYPGCLFSRINDVVLLSTDSGGSGYTSNYYKASGRWTHFVFVENNGTSYYYINGKNHISISTPTIPTGTNYITIGDHPTDNPYIGNIAHFSLYQNPLSPDEIRQHFNATRGRYGY